MYVLPLFIYLCICTIRHSQLLASLQAWCHWISNRTEKTKEMFCQRCLDACIWAITYPSPSLDQLLPSKITHSAVHLFQSVTAILKPNLWDQLIFRDLISTNANPYFKQDTIRILRRALVNGIILPSGDAVTRQRLLGKLRQIKFPNMERRVCVCANGRIHTCKDENFI